MSSLDKIFNRIHALESISETEREGLLNDFMSFKLELEKDDFKLKRTLKDKSIVVNILKATITDLERKKLKLEEVNVLLSDQQEELKKQQKIIEENSNRLSENLKKLEFSYKDLEQFSYIASHDLKSPLRTISSFAQLLKKRYYDHLSEEANEFIDFIVAGVFHMNEVINGLLEYSKVSNINDSKIEVDLNEVIEIVKSNMECELAENQVTLSVSPLPVIVAQKIGIIQLFQNLVHNAIKFRAEAAPIIQISSVYKADTQQWEFKLTDNGIGMSNDYQEKVFQPFQRLNGTKIPGIGMGLAICQKVVKSHGGHIYYESALSAGTTFTFTLSSLKS
ncbi:MAG: ATP-binding protein [Saprospiraceae bacterium]